jgi:glycosyltransferase involved in cell wall biosynthesis
MIICFVFRPNKNRFSIEQVFNSVIDELILGDVCEIKKYTWDSSVTWLQNVLALRRIDCDVFHITGDINHVAIGLIGKRVVSTIHDIGSLKEYNILKKVIYFIFWIYLPIRISSITTTVSEFTKSKIHQLPFLRNSKIFVLVNPVSPNFSKCTSEFPKNDKFTVLFIGTGKHKNIGIGIKIAMSLDCRIIVVGKRTEDYEILENSKIKFDWFDNISENEIIKCYMRSHVLLFMSLHEGFGLPIIEANSLGIPVIASNIEPLLTVGGDSVFYSDPFDEIQIRFFLTTLMHDVEVYNDAVEKGRKNATRYSHSFVAIDYFKLYKLIFNEL